jgi:NADPH2:quinone reductase
MQIFKVEKPSVINLTTSDEIKVVKENQVLIKQSMVGLNYADYQYTYGIKTIEHIGNISPVIPGIEGVGTIEHVGPLVKYFKAGDRVAYACEFGGGGFAEYKLMDQDRIFPVPKAITDEAAAAYLTKGMFAHALLRRIFFAVKNSYILIHPSTSSVGQIMLRLAKHYKIRAISCICNDTSKERISEVKELSHAIVNIDSKYFFNELNNITKSKPITP